MGFHSSLFSRVGVVLAFVIYGSGCLKNTGVVEKISKTTALSQNCLLPNSLAVQNVSRSLAAASVVVGPDFCSNVVDYTCMRKRFSPTAANGKSVVEECARVDELGGEVCLKVSTQSYDTSEAAKRPEVSLTDTQPGGELNRSDYLCDHSKLLDGENFLAIGEGEHLGEALLNAYAKCAAIAPRLSAGK